MAKKEQKLTRGRVVTFRVDEDELAIIQRRAKQQGLTVANYIRLVTLHSDIDSKVSY